MWEGEIVANSDRNLPTIHPDANVTKAAIVGVRKLRAALRVLESAIEAGDGDLVLAAGLDIQTGGEFWNMWLATADYGEPGDDYDPDAHAKAVHTRYEAAINHVDPGYQALFNEYVYGS